MAITLYGIPMSRTSRCLWMLEELGVPYENVPVNFIGDAQKPDYLRVNPNGRVPALDDDGLLLFESLAINLHLARKYDGGKGLWPKSADDQSRAIQWSIWAMTEVEPPVMKVLVNRAFLPEPQRNEAEAKAGEQALVRPVGVLEGALRGRPYLLGDAFTVADLNVHAVLGWATSLGKMKFDATPNVAGWLKRCGERPALARAIGLMRA
jgi:glutathione S-transferase